MASAFDLDEVLPEVAIDSVRLPRKQAGNSPQGMAVTLLADYSLRTRAWLPSAAIVALLAESGVTLAGARAAISRLSRRGVLETRRQGRHTSCRLTAPAAFALAFGAREIASFAAEAESWDGCWTLIAFSVPQESGTRRRALRGRLRWLGYAPLYDALWISPHDHPGRVAAELGRIGIDTATVFRAEQVELSETLTRDPLEAWDLAGITDRYEVFVRHWIRLLPEIKAGDIAGAAALRARTEVMENYRQFIMLDPRLPMRLMPKGWPRDEAREIFIEVYESLAATTLDHVLGVVARFVDGQRLNLATHTVGELLAGLGPDLASG